jgi:hypothetical protein
MGQKCLEEYTADARCLTVVWKDWFVFRKFLYSRVGSPTALDLLNLPVAYLAIVYINSTISE